MFRPHREVASLLKRSCFGGTGGTLHSHGPAGLDLPLTIRASRKEIPCHLGIFYNLVCRQIWAPEQKAG